MEQQTPAIQQAQCLVRKRLRDRFSSPCNRLPTPAQLLLKFSLLRINLIALLVTTFLRFKPTMQPIIGNKAMQRLAKQAGFRVAMIGLQLPPASLLAKQMLCGMMRQLKLGALK